MRSRIDDSELIDKKYLAKLRMRISRSTIKKAQVNTLDRSAGSKAPRKPASRVESKT
jgi:hypothetical protein